MKNKDLLPVLNGDRVDLVALIRNVWNGRRIVIMTFLFFAVIGILVAIISPVKYRSGSILIPQAEEQKSLGQLGGLASLAGVNIGEMLGNASGISPELYPNIVGSFPFLNELVNSEFVFEDEVEAMTLYEKMNKDHRENKWKKYTIRLPWTLKDLLFREERIMPSVKSAHVEKLVVISKSKAMFLGQLHGSISVEVSNKTGLISVGVVHEDAYVSAQIAEKLVSMLQQYVINYKTSQVRTNLEFVEARLEEKRREFERAQRLFFEYQDAHRNRVSERIEPKYQELSDAHNLSRAIYQNLAQQVEQIRLSVKKETPVFTVIEPVKVPLEKSEPRRSFIIITYSFLGLMAGLGLLYGLIMFKKIQESWRKE